MPWPWITNLVKCLNIAASSTYASLSQFSLPYSCLSYLRYVLSTNLAIPFHAKLFPSDISTILLYILPFKHKTKLKMSKRENHFPKMLTIEIPCLSTQFQSKRLDHLHPDHGLVFRSFIYLFDQLKERQDASYVIRASYLEIYNEKVRVNRCSVLLLQRAHESGKASSFNMQLLYHFG